MLQEIRNFVKNNNKNKIRIKNNCLLKIFFLILNLRYVLLDMFFLFFIGEQRLAWVFSTLVAQSGLQSGALASDRVKNSDGADESPNPLVTTFGQVPGGGVFSAKLEIHIGRMNHSPHLLAGLPGILRR